jgi:hypothetical protein
MRTLVGFPGPDRTFRVRGFPSDHWFFIRSGEPVTGRFCGCLAISGQFFNPFCIIFHSLGQFAGRFEPAGRSRHLWKIILPKEC